MPEPSGEYLADKLVGAGMPAAFLAGGQPQAERMATLSAVRGFRLRVIVSTDLVRSRCEPCKWMHAICARVSWSGSSPQFRCVLSNPHLREYAYCCGFRLNYATAHCPMPWHGLLSLATFDGKPAERAGQRRRWPAAWT